MPFNLYVSAIRREHILNALEIYGEDDDNEKEKEKEKRKKKKLEGQKVMNA